MPIVNNWTSAVSCGYNYYENIAMMAGNVAGFGILIYQKKSAPVLIVA